MSDPAGVRRRTIVRAFSVREWSGTYRTDAVTRRQADSLFRSLARLWGLIHPGGVFGVFVCLRHSCRPRTNRARSRRSISNRVMHLIPRPMHASGILILRVDAEGTSCVTTVCRPASA